MNVLIVGSGGREHALAWALKKSPDVGTLWCVSGNAGIASVARCAQVDPSDLSAVTAFHREKDIGLTVVGPELPLVQGLADAIRAGGGRVFGPGRAAARLEGSKVFAKNFMQAYGIPTARFRTFSDAGSALGFVRSSEWETSFRVVKASGLAGGKGVVVCSDREEVLRAIESTMVRRSFGSAGDQVVLEEALIGDELSVMALCDGKTILPLIPSRDHKRIFDGEKGPNTGGMGAFAPVSSIPQRDLSAMRKILDAFVRGLQAEGLEYCGVIYFGFMLTAAGPKVLEFNVRFGDPETQVVVPLVENDWLDLMLAVVEGRLEKIKIVQSGRSSVCVVMVSEGYPGHYKTGSPISGLESFVNQKDVFVFHAGTKVEASTGRCQTSGGRVLGVTALGADLPSARRRAYESVGLIKFEGAHYRKDIAAGVAAAQAR